MHKSPATQVAQEHGLSLLRCLEPANRLSPNLHGEALNRLGESACPKAEWPWGNLNGSEVLQLLWARLAEPAARPTVVAEPSPAALPPGRD